jgi:hypothetical protein
MAELTSDPKSILSVYTNWFVDNKLYVNRRYQRKLVWTLEEKQKLIESILKKYPIPAILLAEREGTAGAFEIIDGLQRLQAIMSFVETSFPTLDRKIFNLQHFPTAKGRADEGSFSPTESNQKLSQKEVTTILDYNLTISIMRNVTEEEINDVFDRINSFGRRLSDQERRQAGTENDFSSMIREIACTLRGDGTDNILLLQAMPSISIDLPMTKHGYDVKAEDVFWVNQGILRATDLRESMDEQCIADIAACIIGGQMIERSKDALDKIYDPEDSESERILSALEVKGRTEFMAEFKFCVDEIIKVCNAEKVEKLRNIIYNKKRTTNPFPSVFAVILQAFHELIIQERKKIIDYYEIKKAIKDLYKRIETDRKSTQSEERRKNVKQIKGLIEEYFVDGDMRSKIYGNHATVDISELVRRSHIELANYELKQGIVNLNDKRDINQDLIERIFQTATAIANNGPHNVGKIMIGVTDKDSDAKRISELDNIEPHKVGKRFIVGINREAVALGISVDKYVSTLRNKIRKSLISEPLRGSILSNLDYNDFYGYGLIILTIQPQNQISFFGEEVFWRDGDETTCATSPKKVTELQARFFVSHYPQQK